MLRFLSICDIFLFESNNGPAYFFLEVTYETQYVDSRKQVGFL